MKLKSKNSAVKHVRGQCLQMLTRVTLSERSVPDLGTVRLGVGPQQAGDEHGNVQREFG
jgi:hypothetical protein